MAVERVASNRSIFPSPFQPKPFGRQCSPNESNFWTLGKILRYLLIRRGGGHSTIPDSPRTRTAEPIAIKPPRIQSKQGSIAISMLSQSKQGSIAISMRYAMAMRYRVRDRQGSKWTQRKRNSPNSDSSSTHSQSGSSSKTRTSLLCRSKRKK